MWHALRYSEGRGLHLGSPVLAEGGMEGDNKEPESRTMPLHDWTDDRGWDSVHLSRIPWPDMPT